jgi:glutamate racemase
MNTNPIGIIDSGSGGLSIWQSIRDQCPKESVVYFGDHKYLPYGSKSTSFIISRIKNILLFLKTEYSCKLFIIACNSATVAGIETYRIGFPDMPIIGVVPVVKTAAEITKTGSIAVLATPYTTKSAYQKMLIQRYAADKNVYAIGCPKLVSYIEKGITKGPLIQKALKDAFRKVFLSNIDAVALGCTHYPFIKEEIAAVLGPSVRLLDSGGAVARQTIRIMKTTGICSEKKIQSDKFLTSGNAKQVSGIASKLIHSRVAFSDVTIV